MIRRTLERLGLRRRSTYRGEILTDSPRAFYRLPDEAVATLPHTHITVDEETYWGLMYLHIHVRRVLASGEMVDEALSCLSSDAERRLTQSRERNRIDPDHHRRG